MKPLRVHGLPLHPMLVHFPVAAWTVATGLAVLAPLELAVDIPRFAVYANAFGIVTGALAMLAGLLELAALPAERNLRDTVARHFALAGSAWLTYCLMWVLQMKALLLPAAATAIAGFILLAAAGHAGARVVYCHGFPRRGFPHQPDHQ